MISGDAERKSGRSDPGQLIFDPTSPGAGREVTFSETTTAAELNRAGFREETLVEMVARRERMRDELETLRHSVYLRAMEENSNNVSAAARAAGVTRQYMHRWLARA